MSLSLGAEECKYCDLWRLMVMSLKAVNSLDKAKLISGGFTGNMDFKIALKTNNKT